MPTERTAWLASLRRSHRPETILTLLQLQELGPGLYSTRTLNEPLGVQTNSTNVALGRLKRAGLLCYEAWGNKGRLIWWVADWNDRVPDREKQHPRWVLRASGGREAEVLLGSQREVAQRLNIDHKTLTNFLGRRYDNNRLLGKWSIKTDPIEFVTQCN